ncbi:protein phosphatase 1 regulatory subunit 36-like [Pectinophora gossypiella]|uniref:protein phosphatase 1 regulatory subunit 36-like n=1 Tax=Pectinophora gossypiella TaxID=13191 RepID=UPI00214E3050|nr:protein phosphatase 1 regulatory subunit 36-like [Pectinophora gossypiella]
MEDDLSSSGGLYEDGHWMWNDCLGTLIFVSDAAEEEPVSTFVAIKAPLGNIEFRDNLDVMEQMRFRRRYMRKLRTGEPDVITLQDVKDIALFTAPTHIMNPLLINMLHLPTTERFIRALILCCQYYLQIEDKMAIRMKESETKVRTPMSETIENRYREDLADLRLLAAKEYCSMLLGAGELKKFHHMGKEKKRRSLADRDMRLFESLIRTSIQIIWMALGRKNFNRIELEVNRLFKSEIFNSVEHSLQTGYVGKMSAEQRNVLLGQCVRHDKKLTTRSPFINEVFCTRPTDYRMLGLGVIKYDSLTPRLRYLKYAVSGPEDTYKNERIVVGILGLPRADFDTVLNPLPNVPDTCNKSTTSVNNDVLHMSFPDTSEDIISCSNEQRKRWLQRYTRMKISRKNLV